MKVRGLVYEMHGNITAKLKTHMMPSSRLPDAMNTLSKRIGKVSRCTRATGCSSSRG